MPELVAFDASPSRSLANAAVSALERGDAVCFIDHRLSIAQRQQQIDLLQPTQIVDGTGAITKNPAGVGTEPGDAVCCLTSGSSGTPKVAVLTLDAVLASAVRTNEMLGATAASSTWLSCLPWAHIGGMAVMLRSMLCGIPLEVLPHFDAQAVTALAERGAATHTSLVLTALNRIDPSLFAAILLGGAAPPEHRPSNVIATYGMTETGSGVVYDGRPLRDVTVAVDPATSGLLIKSPTQLRSYRNGSQPFTIGPDGTAGWLVTGDAGAVAGDGTVSVVGRIDEVIVTGGEKVHPLVVERALAASPDVAEVCVWKRPDPEWGERVVAYVVAKPGTAVSLESLRSEVEHLAPWERPKEVILVSELPRTASGKVARRLLS